MLTGRVELPLTLFALSAEVSGQQQRFYTFILSFIYHERDYLLLFRGEFLILPPWFGRLSEYESEHLLALELAASVGGVEPELYATEGRGDGRFDGECLRRYSD